MVEKAFGLDADAVILDLEDGVPPAEKDVARGHVSAALRAHGTRQRPVTVVRVNHGGTGRLEGDLEAVVGPGLGAILLPKVESPEEVGDLGVQLARLERTTNLEFGATGIIVAIESAVGLARAGEITCADPRIVAVMFGAEDFALDLGLPVQRLGPGQELIHARSVIVLAAAVARIQALDQVWLNFHDAEGLRSEAISGRHLGFTGKCLIHPSQIEIVNEVFSPSDADVELAREIVEAFESAQATGIGAVMLRGQLVELPIVERALTTLRAHDTLRHGVPEADD